jgi:insecticidal toxin complex protein TccC
MTRNIHHNTPSVTVSDNRGFTVRTLAFCRHPDAPSSQTPAIRITRHQHNDRGALISSADPRLHDAGRVNFTYLSDLNGSVLRTEGADSGTTLTLSDAAGRPFLSVTAPGTPEAVTRSFRYEGATLPGRLLAITERTADGVSRVTDRFLYAGSTQAERDRNLAGQCLRHFDTAGMQRTDSVALTGGPLSVTRQLLKDADNPDIMADWQGEDDSIWHDRLAPEAYTTRTTADATGAVLTSTDAAGHMQRQAYDVAGLLRNSGITLKDGTQKTVVVSLTRTAAGQTLREVHGNGVVTTYAYEPETQRLTGIRTERPAGHPAGGKVLQALRYAYDPAGNVLSIRNDAEATRFWRNQQVKPESTYVYDSLYQLVKATGRERANAGRQGILPPGVTVPLPTDGSAYTNYTRTYAYDTGGNLKQIRHCATGNRYTTDITVSDSSNRGVLSGLTGSPAEVDALFTAGGQQKMLQPGQTLSWTARSELRQVSPVVREGTPDDREHYRYDGGSQRVLKTGVQKTGHSRQTQNVVYLPGLELRTAANDGRVTEVLEVVSAGGTDRAQVRLLHWQTGTPRGIGNNPLRYSCGDLTGSAGMELDGNGEVISLEEYYPYGGTAVWAARNRTEAKYKTVRYSGKERDATGLYYYGWRYYQPWAGRWLSADPAGTADGLNLYRMVRNNPVTLRDKRGLISDEEDIDQDWFGEGYETPPPAESSLLSPTVSELDFSDQLVDRHLPTGQASGVAPSTARAVPSPQWGDSDEEFINNLPLSLLLPPQYHDVQATESGTDQSLLTSTSGAVVHRRGATGDGPRAKRPRLSSPAGESSSQATAPPPAAAPDREVWAPDASGRSRFGEETAEPANTEDYAVTEDLRSQGRIRFYDDNGAGGGIYAAKIDVETVAAGGIMNRIISYRLVEHIPEKAPNYLATLLSRYKWRRVTANGSQLGRRIKKDQLFDPGEKNGKMHVFYIKSATALAPGRYGTLRV